MKFALVALIASQVALAAPECLIDGNRDDGRLVNVISGQAKGFLPKEPVFVTVTNGNRKFTTQTDRAGFWATLYANETQETEVLCWQGLTAVRAK